MSGYNLSHLKQLEAESIHIIREVAAEFDKPVMLYSIGKDSSVMLHLAHKAFAPGRIPFPLMHVDTQWKFREMYRFRELMAENYKVDIKVWINPDGKGRVSPFTHGSEKHTQIMKTDALKQALNHYGFDAAFGGARRDEEKSRAKERVYSFRNQFHQWDPKNQRPELWNLYNARINKGESIRVFPLSNWTELDIWLYLLREEIPIPGFERPALLRDAASGRLKLYLCGPWKDGPWCILKLDDAEDRPEWPSSRWVREMQSRLNALDIAGARMYVWSPGIRGATVNSTGCVACAGSGDRSPGIRSTRGKPLAKALLASVKSGLTAVPQPTRQVVDDSTTARIVVL